MKNTLLGRGILLPTGEISKDKINLVAGAVTEPFAEMVWATTGGDWETINRHGTIFVQLGSIVKGVTRQFLRIRLVGFDLAQRADVTRRNCRDGRRKVYFAGAGCASLFQ